MENKNNEILLSFILPIYNVEAYLEECIDSILDQITDECEIILVDDGATDSSGEICDRYSEKHSAIRVVHKENGGLSSARNAGLDVSNGDYIMFLDSDDYLAENAVEMLVCANKEDDADIVQFDFFETDKEYYSFCADTLTNISFTQDKKEMLEALGLEESGLDKLIKKSYDLLGLMSFLTAGEPEVRAWTIQKGTKAPKAAGKIHSDIERGFIKAEIVSYEDLVREGSMVAAREKGLVRQEGKEYIMQDGDIVLFKFNV